jgi:very-short-patch-repair endonuclease
VTTPSRTLTDLHRLIPQPQFAAAMQQAEFLGLPIDQRLEPDKTRSELEARFLTLCRRHRLPKPDVNVRVASFTADFLWPKHNLIVELDGYRAHSGRAAFESDRRRDMQLKRLGYEVVRLTWRQVADEARSTASTLRMLLASDRK